MMSIANTPLKHITPEAYLEWEERQTERHEYVDGNIRAMTGGTWSHNLIIGNLMRDLGTLLRGTPCKSLVLSHRVQVTSSRYFYPDLGIVCGTPQFGEQESILNPVALFEVLSPSTERYDRVRKFAYYKQIESLQEYFLVFQDMALVEAFRRSSEGGWIGSTYTAYLGLEAEMEVESVGIKIALRDLYEGVELPEIEIPS